MQISANTAADALSRLGTNAVHTPNTSVADFQELTLAQVNDPDLPKLREDSSLRLESVPFLSEGISIVCDVSTGSQRPYVASIGQFSIRCTQFLILAFVPHNVLYLVGMCGRELTWTSGNGLAHAFSVNVLRCTAMSPPLLVRLPHQTLVLTTYVLILLDPYPCVYLLTCI